MVPFLKLHPGQKTIRDSKARFKIVACGRRFGKTELGKILLLDHLFLQHHVWWVAPTYLMAADVWRSIKDMLRDVPAAHVNEAEHRIDLYSGSLGVRSAFNPDRLRGAGLDFMVLDEAAYMDATLWPEVLRPMLLDRRGGAVFLSTPRGRNWFWNLYQLGDDPEHADWRNFHMPSSANPRLDTAELDAIRRASSERVWREEYLAEFLTGSGQVFRGIETAAIAPLDATPQPGHRYIAGVDWGRDLDYTVIAVLDADTDTLVALDRFTQVGWSLQRARLTALAERWHPSAIWAESNSMGSVNIEALQAEGLPVRPFTTTARSKPPLIEGLALAIERGELTLMPDPVLIAELAAYTQERMPGGGYRYNAPSGLHDDTVIALALAWHGAQAASPLISFA